MDERRDNAEATPLLERKFHLPGSPGLGFGLAILLAAYVLSG